jgi:transposase
MLKKSMSHEIAADYETQYLFPRSLEEWVGPEDPARFIREFVRELDLGELGDEEEGRLAEDNLGRPHYGFELLLSVWLYGYVYGIRSSRQLERGCRQLLPLMWLAGTHQPDHNTLWRFWNRHRSVLREVFRQSVKVAWEANLIGMVLHAVDGTKIASRASRRSGLHREDLRRVMKAVSERIEQLEAEIEKSRDQGEVDDRLPEDLRKQTTLREKIRTAMEQLEQDQQDHQHPHDPDARMMIDGRGRTDFSYNAQAVVDDKAGVVVAADVTNEANDQRQLGPMVDQVRDNVGENAETTVADSGYDTAEGLGHAERNGVSVVVASKQRPDQVGPYHASRFTYDADRDQVQCPRREWLLREGTRKHAKKPYPLQIYRCHVLDCPVRRQCSRDPRGRVIEIGPHYSAVVRNRERLRDPTSREALRKRGATVERLFAEIKETLRFRRWTVAGMEKVQAQWALMCAAMNLRRVILA